MGMGVALFWALLFFFQPIFAGWIAVSNLWAGQRFFLKKDYLCRYNNRLVLTVLEDMRKILVLILILPFLAGFDAYANGEGNDDKKKKKNEEQVSARPDIPGTLLIDLGLNILQNVPSRMDLGNFRSKVVNFYYYYDMPIGESHFSFNPAIGVGLEKFAFDNDITLIDNGDSTFVQELDDLLPDAAIKKTRLAANYFDIPIEFRYHSSKYDHRRSLKVAIGGRVGFLMSSHTKIKYDLQGDTVIEKNKRDFSLSSFRYGVHGRIGYGGFNLFMHYNLSNLFDDGLGPPGTSNSNNITVGISLAGF